MKIDELIIAEDKTVLDAMRQLDVTGRRILFLAPQGRLEGVVTDSDVRRYILRGGKLEAPLREMANYSPKSLPVGERRRAREYLVKNSIDAVPLLNKAGVITDVVFVGDLDVDTHKQLELPVVIM
ncbi:MAG: CBS domain-containing protein, partial [Oscillospiraceae bacterium]|nr:CBS domain-containing protein [Oscillospiraceae bacterium]